MFLKVRECSQHTCGLNYAEYISAFSGTISNVLLITLFDLLIVAVFINFTVSDEGSTGWQSRIL